MATIGLIAAMAVRCRSLIQSSEPRNSALPNVLSARHLIWMCHQIETNADNWPDTKLHRWIGFIQCGLIANQMLTLEDVKKMFDQAKNTHNRGGVDEDLVDHLNLDNQFELEIGGQG